MRCKAAYAAIPHDGAPRDGQRHLVSDTTHVFDVTAVAVDQYHPPARCWSRLLACIVLDAVQEFMTRPSATVTCDEDVE
jgi:hypothetical protein